MVLLAFAGVLLWSVWDSVVPAREITVAPVLVARAEVQQAGTPLFQAAGWVEPRPAATVVSAFAPGMVQEMLVVEGQSVAAGEKIATLVDVDAKLALQQAESEVVVRKAEIEAATQELQSAQHAYDNPASLEAEAADALSLLATIEGELMSLPALTESASTRYRLAQISVQNRQGSNGVVAGKLLRESEREQAAALAEFKDLQVRKTSLTTRQAAMKKKHEALQKQLQAKVVETRNLAIATGKLKTARARLKQAELAAAAAKLTVNRMIIRAPVAGRVLAMHAATGSRLSGINPHSAQGSSAVVTLYDPAKVQVRVDVRLEDVRQVQIGQPVNLLTAASPGSLEGEVVSITSVADIQKNTLQVKVAINNPPQVIRPDMLVEATFIAPATASSAKTPADSQMRMLVPRPLVMDESGKAHIWIADRDSHQARRRAITLGRAGDADLVEVTAGINAADKLICGGREGLRDQQRVRITGEDRSLGLNAGSTRRRVAHGTAESAKR